MKKFSGVICIKNRHIAMAAVFLFATTMCITGYIRDDKEDLSYLPTNRTFPSKTISNHNPENSLHNADDEEKESQTSNETEEETTRSSEKSYIKWVEFNVTQAAMQQAYQYDLKTHENDRQLHFVELLAYLGAKYGGDFSRYNPKDMDEVADKLLENDITMEQLAKDMKYYGYYREAYGAVLNGLVGEYQIPSQYVSSSNQNVSEENTSGNEENETEKFETGENEDAEYQWVTQYGLKAFSPIAKGFPYADYDDFGASRSYGYKRNHLGHDMMGQVGTPIVAVESGYVQELGWNQYGGWRIGINSFDGKRYYYYAHLRQDFPYAKWIKKGSIIQAGDVIGYMGRTGYSAKENVNNIEVYHLHFGLQLIFDESQRDGNNQIWVDVFPLVKFLYQNQSEAARDDATKEWKRVMPIRDPQAEEYKKQHKENE